MTKRSLSKKARRALARNRKVATTAKAKAKKSYTPDPRGSVESRLRAAIDVAAGYADTPEDKHRRQMVAISLANTAKWSVPE